MKNNFYKAFEDRFRGSREEIYERLRFYIPLIKIIKEVDINANAIDLGCGRGEWLQLLQDNGIQAYGVDMDEGMLENAKMFGLSVELRDAVEYLKSMSDSSISIVSGFHIAEHLPFEILQELIKEAFRVLKPAGILLLETPNPENIKVATANFYFDPTHTRPIPLELLSFLPEYHGFFRTKVIRLQEDQFLSCSKFVTVADIINGASPDYAVIAQKQDNTQTLAIFNQYFSKDYGLTLDDLVNRYENRIANMAIEINEAIVKANEVEQSANEAIVKANEAIVKANEVEQSANEAWQNYYMIEKSNSWRITKPLRLAGKAVRWFVRGAYHWLTFSPTSRPRRIIKNLLLKIKNYIDTRPKLKYKILNILNRFPKLKARLRRVGKNNYSISNNSKSNMQNIKSTHLSPRAKEIYLGLKKAIDEQKADGEK